MSFWTEPLWPRLREWMDKHAAPIRDLLWIMWIGYAAYAIGLWAFGVEGSR